MCFVYPVSDFIYPGRHPALWVKEADNQRQCESMNISLALSIHKQDKQPLDEKTHAGPSLGESGLHTRITY